nr:SDR family oxidoreductase [Pseudomonas sp.]
MLSTTKTALVTGAASGIGLACAQALSQAGHALVLLDKSEAIHDVAKALIEQGREVHVLLADLADAQAIAALPQRLQEIGANVDILVNNAGIHMKRDGKIPEFQDITLDDWETTFRINCTAPFLLAQALIPGMRARGFGRVVNIASRAGRTYSPRAGTHYSASKAAIIGLTRKIAGDFAADGITANAIAPGQVDTPLAQRSAPEVLERAIRNIPAGRMGKAEEIAAAVTFLASEGAAYVNGAVLDVNGGETMV